MKSVALFVLVIASLAFANPFKNANAKTELKDDDWRYELLEGDCSNLYHYDVLVKKEIQREGTDEVQYSGEKIIKCINVENKNHAGDGGNVAIVGGGIGQHTVELKFKSTSTAGMDFDVNIYGIY